MTRAPGSTVGPVTHSSPSAPSASPPVDFAGTFLAGELLSRAEARAGEGGLRPPDLGIGFAPPVAASVLGLVCWSENCINPPPIISFVVCESRGFLRPSCELPDRRETDPETPDEPGRPAQPGKPDDPRQ